MCLVVGTKKLVAKTDLLVFKCLDYDKKSRTYCTPFQYMPVTFNKGMKVIGSDGRALTIQKEYQERYGGKVKVINYGVHAYTTRNEAEWTASQFPNSGTKMHYAVIPKGCPYYIGLQFDIVTTELIVFKTKKDFDKYAEGKNIKEI